MSGQVDDRQDENQEWEHWIAAAVFLFFIVLGFFLIKGCEDPAATVRQTIGDARDSVVTTFGSPQNEANARSDANAEAERLRLEAEARARAAAAESDALLNAFGGKIGDFFDHTLPNGAEIKIPEGGMESALLDQLKRVAAGAGLGTVATTVGSSDSTESTDTKSRRFNFDRIYFATGSAALNAESTDQISSVAAILNAYPKARVHLRGHTDSVGAEASNQVLSEARAASVKTALVSGGIGGDRITTEGLGESQPADTNATEQGRQNNRRIEFSLRR